jgi:hypothetical protein
MPAMQRQLGLERKDLVEALAAVRARRVGVQAAMRHLPESGPGAEARAAKETVITRLRRVEGRLDEAVEKMT